MGMDGTFCREPSTSTPIEFEDAMEISIDCLSQSKPTVEWHSPCFRTGVLIDVQRHISNTYLPLIPKYPALLGSFVEQNENLKTTFSKR